MQLLDLRLADSSPKARHHVLDARLNALGHIKAAFDQNYPPCLLDLGLGFRIQAELIEVVGNRPVCLLCRGPLMRVSVRLN